MEDLTITYYGHSCFTVEYSGFTVAIDPYGDGSVPGLGPVRIEADEVLCTHGHGDHSFRAGVRLRSGTPNPFSVETISCPHDDRGGALRGMNSIIVLRAGGLSCVHMGDVGCMLPDGDIEKLRGCDVLLLPVGGYYTVDAAAAHALAEKIAPRVLIPMHYRTPSSGFDVLAPLSDFTAVHGGTPAGSCRISVGAGNAPGTWILEQKNLL